MVENRCFCEVLSWPAMFSGMHLMYVCLPQNQTKLNNMGQVESLSLRNCSAKLEKYEDKLTNTCLFQFYSTYHWLSLICYAEMGEILVCE